MDVVSARPLQVRTMRLRSLYDDYMRPFSEKKRVKGGSRDPYRRRALGARSPPKNYDVPPEEQLCARDGRYQVLCVL